jgi:signal peptidase I
MRTAVTATLVAAAAGVGALVAVRRRWMVVTVRGTSMLPALRPGDVVLVRRGAPARMAVGDVVVLDPPDGTARPTSRRPGPGRTWLVKRIAAGPGEPLPYPGEGRVPPGAVAVLGDNGGHDSRRFGPVPHERVLGVVVRRIAAAERSTHGQ